MTTTIRTGVDGIVVRLDEADPIAFRSFIDCNMASAWVGETFRIFPGKYGEDPVWGRADDLVSSDGATVREAFEREREDCAHPALPPNAPAGTPGLHGAVWFETVYSAPSDPSGRTLFALYHNENYPETLPLDEATGEGLSAGDWPPGLTGDDSVQAVPRIGIMASTDGGESWADRGVILEDRDERMIRLPVNRNHCFPGGVGDPSAVASGEHLYVFLGEYAYPGPWDADSWDRETETAGQCVSVARIPLDRLDDPHAAATRWDGTAFAAPWNGAGAPIAPLRIADEEGGGAVSQGDERYYWGPSVSWNEHVDAWVMLLGRVDAPFWVGDTVLISVNPHRNLGDGDNAQRWSTPVELLRRPGHTLWYPSLQPTDSAEDLLARRTSLRLGRQARLFVKDITPEGDHYSSELLVTLDRESLA